jgi:hypothetical protein
LIDEAMRRELLTRIEHDDTVRERLARDGSLFDGYHPEMEAVHRDNAAWLAELVARRGWPGRAAAGIDGASAAWRILQHAIGEPALMRGLFPQVCDAVACGEAEAGELAMLEDRIRVLEGRPQRYGTQYDWNDGGTAMVPIVGVDDPEHVETRRCDVGLPPMRWQLPPPPDQPPPRDVAAHRAAGEAWARRVGWR